MKKNNNHFSLHIDPNLSFIKSDLTKVQQILYNLLSNAAKFTEDGDIELHVNHENDNLGEWVVLKVKDTGIGISADQIEKLFDSFSQADASITRKFGGTGLGLAISARLCEMIGGQITVQSSSGEGSTFTVKLPVDIDTVHHHVLRRTIAG